MLLCWAIATPAKAKATTATPSRIFLIMMFPSNGQEPSSARGAGKAGEARSALDPRKTCRDAALKQRPVKTQRQRQIAAIDHRIGLFGGARDAADRHTAFHNAFLRPLHQRDHLRVIGQAALVDGGGEIAGP